MKFFYRVDVKNQPVPGSLIKSKEKPINGKWRQVPTDACCDDLCGCSTTLTYDFSSIPQCGDTRITLTINSIDVIVFQTNDASSVAQTVEGVLTVREGDIVSLLVENLDACVLSGGIDINGSIVGIIQDFSGDTGSIGNLTDPVPFTVNCENTYTAVVDVSSNPS